nr:Uncharacterised protein [Raoultella sp. NCTC 9187]
MVSNSVADELRDNELWSAKFHDRIKCILIVVFSDIGITDAGLTNQNFTCRRVDTIHDDSPVVLALFFLVEFVGRNCTSFQLPGALVVGELVTGAPFEIKDAFRRQVVKYREVGADRLIVVMATARFDSRIFQIYFELQVSASFRFRGAPDNAVWLA